MSTFDYAQFYSLSDPFGTQALRLARHASSKWLDGKMAVKLANGGTVQYNRELKLCSRSGRRPLPFLWTEFPPIVCISNRVTDLFQKNRITGWSTYPVTITDRDEQPLLDYFGFAVNGRAGNFKRELSTVTKIEHPWGSVVDVYMGFFFNPTDWDGSDIFRLSGKIVVTQKVQQLLRKERISNVEFTSLIDIETPLYMVNE